MVTAGNDPINWVIQYLYKYFDQNWVIYVPALETY